MIDEALATLRALADDTKAAEMAAYHKAPRVYLGVTVPQITELANGWREQLSVEDRVTLADELWQSDIHEARVAATKLLTQARLRPDDGAWALIQSWVPPWTKMNFPKPADLDIRDRVLGWAAIYATDPDWFIQKAIAWWLRDLSKHDAERSRAFLAAHGDKMKPFARKEAAKYL
ncbi:MAG: DNA alkylation repair protein [Rhodobacteraceae bacterium PARR1]|nr:MAG: DNA alkylation repair protein [Rhodobacteraceae bacterium PARR1]